jgi:carbamoylphosphate synthase large subunit
VPNSCGEVTAIDSNIKEALLQLSVSIDLNYDINQQLAKMRDIQSLVKSSKKL